MELINGNSSDINCQTIYGEKTLNNKDLTCSIE